MSRFRLYDDDRLVYDSGGASLPDPVPTPPPTPPQPPSAPSGSFDMVLSPPGQHPTPIPRASCRVLIENITTNQLQLEIGNCFAPYTITVYNPDGSEAIKYRPLFAGVPLGQPSPAVLTGPNTSLLVDTTVPGNYTAQVEIDGEVGLAQLNHWRNAL